MKNRILIILILFILLIIQHSNTFAGEGKTAFGAAWRSALCPGWGQYYYNGQRTKGVIIAGGIFITGGITLITYSMHERAVNSYNNAPSGSDFDALVKKEETLKTINNISFFVTIGLWVYNIFDAYIFHGYDDINTNRQTNNINNLERLTIELTQERIVLSYNIKQF